jgi:hypothetical protein
VRPRRVIALALRAAPAVALLLVAAAAFARPGGGDVFSGPSGSGGGGGGDIDIGLVIEIAYLCYQYPPLGAVVLVGAAGYYVFKLRARRGLAEWSTAMPARVETQTQARSARNELGLLRARDPSFSTILFEDFAYTLYAELQISRARGAVARLAAFLSPAVAQLLYDPALERVDGVVIGALRLLRVELSPERSAVTLEVEANFSEWRNGYPQRYYVADRLTLTRAAAARSRPPARVRKLDCPNCGAPLEGMRGTTCGYCRTEVGGGRLDWLVESLTRFATEQRPPLLSGETVERGNQLPTLVSPGCQARLLELGQRDPSHDPAALWARIGLIFAELQAGWSSRDLSRSRPFVTDNLFQYFGYWIDAYVTQKARNVTENTRILNVELADVTADATYDAVTVRVFATGLDYTLADDGRLLRGSRSAERPYTEYWTLVRGSAARGRPRADLACPCCGAPLKIGMAGNCEYCHSRVVAGEFDWVLSKIEQDEAYRG